MKLVSIFAALALASPAALVAQTSASTHALAWHPSGKTPAAIPQARAKRSCIQAADHHRGSKGPVTPVVRCTENTEMAQTSPQAVERGE